MHGMLVGMRNSGESLYDFTRTRPVESRHKDASFILYHNVINTSIVPTTIAYTTVSLNSS